MFLENFIMTFCHKIYKHIIKIHLSETCSEPCQTSKMERLMKIVNGWKPLTIFAKRCLLDVLQGFKYDSTYGE